MTQIQVLDLIFWLMAIFGLLDLFFLFRRRLQREVSWFAVYLAIVVVQSVVSVYLLGYQPPYVYYYVGWGFIALDLVIEYMFTIEIIRNMLVEYPTVRSWVRNTLLAVAAVFVLVALFALPYGADQPNVYMKVTHLAVRSVRIIQLSVLLCFFLLASFLGLSWKNYQFGILLGLGLYACCNLACEAYLAQVGASVGWKVTLVDSYASICMMLIFLIYLAKAETAIPLAGPPHATELDEWGQTLTDWKEKNRPRGSTLL